jgi:hypothetical protein
MLYCGVKSGSDKKRLKFARISWLSWSNSLVSLATGKFGLKASTALRAEGERRLDMCPTASFASADAEEAIPAADTGKRAAAAEALAAMLARLARPRPGKVVKWTANVAISLTEVTSSLAKRVARSSKPGKANS